MGVATAQCVPLRVRLQTLHNIERKETETWAYARVSSCPTGSWYARV